MTVFDRQMRFEDVDDDYREFVDKFRPKRTTDDCYTPEPVYNAVRDYACARYGIRPDSIVRPFWPGGDYERFDYPDGCFVLDNPPFSILARILSFYRRHGIRYFLFAPGLTALCGGNTHTLCCGVCVTYENGAEVNTSFVTSEGDAVAEACPDLYRAVKAANDANLKAAKKAVAKLELPDCIATAARLNWLAAHGVPFSVPEGEAMYVRKLDNYSKGVFGGAWMLSARAAAERAAAERVALSDRELEMQKRIGDGRI